jgi:Zn-dependent protease
MKGPGSQSFHIGTFAGIPVKIHWTFGFTVILIMYIGFQDQLSLHGYFWLAMTVISLFTCVVLHEYGHALTARKYGIKTTDILLTPIGGIARLRGMPQKPIQEFLIAIAGPLVNVALMLISGLYLYFAIDQTSSELLEDLIIIDSFSELVVYLFFLNFMLFAFNLVPAFPMDGGRILRSLLSLKMERIKATRIASITGRVIAVVFVIIAIVYRQFSLGFIGVFVFIMAQREFKMVEIEDRIKKAKVGQIMRTDYSLFYGIQSIQDVMDKYKEGKEGSFIVFNHMNQVEGVIHEYFLKNLPDDFHGSDSIRKILSVRFEFVTPDLSLDSLFKIMQEKGYSIVPVIFNDKIIGVVDRQDVMSYVKSKN